MNQKISLFLAHVRESPDFKCKVLEAPSIDAVIALAKEEGFDLDLESVLKLRSSFANELSDRELEAVAGGAATKAEAGCWTAKGGPTGCQWGGCKR